MGLQQLFLIRHGQSYKNVRDEHGGGGDVLSPLGREQCKKICSFLYSEKLREDNSVIFWHSIPQVAETIEKIYVYKCPSFD